MRLRDIRYILISFVTLCAILVISAAVIAYGRGYRPNQSGLSSTGIISATSDPIGAQVYVDSVLKTATNNAFNVDPGWHTVDISKEGYIPWQKRLRIQGEIVSRADAYLFPNNPSLSPITTTGIISPTISSDGTKIAYIIKNTNKTNDINSRTKAGVWIYELANRPLGFNRDQRQIAAEDSRLNYDTATIIWSPDGSELLVDDGTTTIRYVTNRLDAGTVVTATKPTILTDWKAEKNLEDNQKLSAYKQPIIDTATSSARIIAFSPDESKLLYEATAAATLPRVINPPLIGANATEEVRDIIPGKVYVYDSREDKNYLLLDSSELPSRPPTPTPTRAGRPTPTPRGPLAGEAAYDTLFWFPTNRHIVVPFGDKIDVLEYDRTNWITIYSGPFESGFIAPWNDGSKIIILTNLNPGASSLPNLYTVNLR